MPIKIIRSDEPIRVEQLVTTIYAPPGLGKTTLAFTADSPLLIDFDKGAHRAVGRRDSVPVDTWQDVTDIKPDDLSGYKTLVVDTTGRALDILTLDIIRRNPKMGRGGALTLQGYGALKSEFTAWLKMIKSIGIDPILLAHSTEEKSGDDILERLDVQGGSKGEIYKSSDVMGRLSLTNGKRMLNFSPTDTAYGKNPGQLPPLNVPDSDKDPNFLGGVIRSIKDKLNSLTEEQIARQNEVSNWAECVKNASSVDDYNILISDLDTLNKNILPIAKRELHNAATEAGFIFDSKLKKYTVAQNG